MVESHSNIYKLLGISDEFEFKGTKSERGNVAKRLNNVSGQLLTVCPRGLVHLYTIFSGFKTN